MSLFKNRCLFFHSWSKWEQYKIEVFSRYITQKTFERRQKRICSCGGKAQDEIIY